MQALYTTFRSPSGQALKTLFMQAPCFDCVGGCAGLRYQASRAIKSFRFLTWFAQPAAFAPKSRVLDAPGECLTVEQCREIARDDNIVVMHTGTSSFPTDAKFAEPLKQDNPNVEKDLAGMWAMVDTEGSLKGASAVATPVRRH